MTTDFLVSLTDSDLLVETARAATAERRSTAELVALLAELDVRQLYLGRGYSSLFVYCTQSLHLSESAAYARITAARAARSFPAILARLTDGSVTLTTISLLASHLNSNNHDALLDAARHKSRREVERLVADLEPLPDVAPTIRRAPERSAPALLTAAASTSRTAASTPVSSPPPPAAHRPVVAPLGDDRYLVRVMLSHDGHEKLERARALLRHQIPNADPAAVIERALTTLVEQLERTKHASSLRPRAQATTAPSTSRHVPAAVKRAVWARDDGRCAFVGADGRCSETGFLEFHHVVPFSTGGATDIENLQLRCRAHNAYEATLFEQSRDVTVNTPG